MRLKEVIAPRLPDAEPTYMQRGADTLRGILRLYFNRITYTINQITGVNGGQYVDCPYGLFFNTNPQTLSAINTATAVTVPTAYLSNAVSLHVGSTSKIEASVGGIYNVQMSGQLESTSSSAKTVWLWISREDVAIGYSTHVYTISGSGTHMEINWNFNIDLQAGQHVELFWASDSTTVTLKATAASSPHPGVPSAVIAVNFVAPPPPTLPTPP